MAQYDTVTKQVTEDITVTISKKKGATAGEKLVAFLEWLSEKVVDPDYGIDSGLKPDQGLPGGGSGGKPDQSLPGAGGSPSHPIAPGGGSGNKPDQSLPGSQPGPDQSLPGSQPEVDNGLPDFLGQHAEQIAKLILGKCMDCKDETAQPK